jgi:hypothetical protein
MAAAVCELLGACASCNSLVTLYIVPLHLSVKQTSLQARFVVLSAADFLSRWAQPCLPDVPILVFVTWPLPVLSCTVLHMFSWPSRHGVVCNTCSSKFYVLVNPCCM